MALARHGQLGGEEHPRSQWWHCTRARLWARQLVCVQLCQGLGAARTWTCRSDARLAARDADDSPPRVPNPLSVAQGAASSGLIVRDGATLTRPARSLTSQLLRPQPVLQTGRRSNRAD